MSYLDIEDDVPSNEHPLGALPRFSQEYCIGSRDIILELRLRHYAETLQSVGYDREYILGHAWRDVREWYPRDRVQCRALIAQIEQLFQ